MRVRVPNWVTCILEIFIDLDPTQNFSNYINPYVYDLASACFTRLAEVKRMLTRIGRCNVKNDRQNKCIIQMFFDRYQSLDTAFSYIQLICGTHKGVREAKLHAELTFMDLNVRNVSSFIIRFNENTLVPAKTGYHYKVHVSIFTSDDQTVNFNALFYTTKIKEEQKNGN